jgi:membrane-bound lytic murein transglycosylase B
MGILAAHGCTHGQACLFLPAHGYGGPTGTGYPGAMLMSKYDHSKMMAHTYWNLQDQYQGVGI